MGGLAPGPHALPASGHREGPDPRPRPFGLCVLLAIYDSGARSVRHHLCRRQPGRRIFRCPRRHGLLLARLRRAPAAIRGRSRDCRLRSARHLARRSGRHARRSPQCRTSRRSPPTLDLGRTREPVVAPRTSPRPLHRRTHRFAPFPQHRCKLAIARPPVVAPIIRRRIENPRRLPRRLSPAGAREPRPSVRPANRPDLAR